MDITISKYWQIFTAKLFPEPPIFLCDPTENHLQLMLILDTICISDFFISYDFSRGRGRPPIDREQFAKAFIAKSVLNLPTTVALIDRLKIDIVLRRICGFFSKNCLPCEASFSNAFKEFSDTGLPEKIHETLVKKSHQNLIVHNVSRDSTAIEAREKPVKKEISQPEEKVHPKRKKGRPKKDEIIPPKAPSILEKQQSQSLEIMRSFLSQKCDFGCKKNSHGFIESWIGYKLHIDTGDCDIPLSCILTSASVHDSTVSLPLEAITNQRVCSLYTLADAAYDSLIIKNDIENRGKVPVIDSNKRRGEKIPFDPAKKERYKNRSSAERINGLLKDNYGGRSVMVKGASKIMCHLMFGIISITAMQIAKVFL